VHQESDKETELFCDGNLHETLLKNLRSVEEKVNSISSEQFLDTPIDSLIEYISNQSLT
jgi:hypothetical protein